jgi:hypothetical protein
MSSEKQLKPRSQTRQENKENLKTIEKIKQEVRTSVH